MNIHVGFSRDGVHWDIEKEVITFQNDDPEVLRSHYRYDPRVCWIEDRYVITWCNGYCGPTIGVGWTKDFKEFHQMENAFLPFNRNGVMFPPPYRGPIRDAQPAQRQRAHPLWGHLLQ